MLNDDEVLQLARWACAIEKHYGQPMDIEWAKDGESGELFIVQARPETVQSRKDAGTLKSYVLKSTGAKLVSGLAVGDSISTGKVCRLASAKDIDRFQDGAVLVTETTDPDWVPIMKKAAAIVTDRGGRTSHAAIVSRELGLTAIVGAHHATAVLKDGMEVTVSCAEGDEGHVYAGAADFAVEEIRIDDIPQTRTKVMLNLGDPSIAFRWWRLPADGVGLARMEFIIGNLIRVHPMALVHYDKVKDARARAQIAQITRGYADKTEYFVDTLARGVARIAAAHYPNPVIVRLSDFKTNEYARLIGGEGFEPAEENPMLGWRGASRYYSDGYRDGFALECRALRRAREEIGLTNIVVMVPFCRSPEEADRVLAEMAKNGLQRGNGLEIFVMCEIPSNVILAGAVRRALRRLFHRLERPHAARARRGPRQCHAQVALRRAQPRCNGRYRDIARESTAQRHQNRDLRPGAERSSRVRALPRRARDRFDIGDARQLSGGEARRRRGGEGHAGHGAQGARARGGRCGRRESGIVPDAPALGSSRA